MRGQCLARMRAQLLPPIMTKSLLKTSLLGLSVCSAAAMADPQTLFPNPGPYTQDYATAWFTEDLGAGNKLFQYAVINLGTVAYQERTTQTGPNSWQRDWRTDTPMMRTYEAPIMSEFALNAIQPGSIFQPEGWSYRFIDLSQEPGAWVNTTGDARFDKPYRLLQWYVDSANASNAIEHIANHAIHPSEWLTRTSLSEAMADPQAQAKFGGTQCGLMLWNEGCAGLGFGFQAQAGKMLGPDQTAWTLITRMGSDSIIVNPLPPQIGDPDLPVGHNGLSFGGGVVTIAPTAAVPEPASYALALSGLALLAGLARKRRQG